MRPGYREQERHRAVAVQQHPVSLGARDSELSVQRPCILALLVGAMPLWPERLVAQSAIASDSAIYATLRGTRAAYVAPEAFDLRDWLGAGSVGRELAMQLTGFDTTLVIRLHQANPAGRGPGIALRLRPELLTRSPDAVVYGPAARVDLNNGSIIRERVPYVAYNTTLRFSVVQYSAADDLAVVMENTECGPVCGGSRYVVLRRTPTGHWAIVASYQAAIS